MVKKKTDKDLFGRPVKVRRPKYEATLERWDRSTRSERAARMRWVYDKVAGGWIMALSAETHYALQEALSSFVNGNYVSVIMLAAAFAEHWFVGGLIDRGFSHKKINSFYAALEIARKEQIVDGLLLDKVERLRQIRNPIAHLKPFGHPNGIIERSLARRVRPSEQLEYDARESILTMYAVAEFAFRSP